MIYEIKVDRVKKVVTALQTLLKDSPFEGHCYMVGGSVRDLLMGKTEIKDIDLCFDINGGGVDFVDYVCLKYPELCSGKTIFKSFGTAKFALLVEGIKEDIECVHTRSEVYPDKLSRNPLTDFGTLEEDAKRRDLTINSLYYNVSNGEIIDPTGMGMEDLSNQILRTPLDPILTFIDDPLRILRVIRFHSRYGWEIDKKTSKAMRQTAHRLEIITKERIGEELNKILVSDYVVSGLDLLMNLKIMEYVIPNLERTKGLKQSIVYHFGDVWQHTLETVKNSSPIAVNRMAALLHDIGKISTQVIGDTEKDIHFYKHELIGAQIAEMILKDLKYPTSFVNSVVFVIQEHMRTKSFGNTVANVKDKVIRKLVRDLGNRLDLVLDVINADNKSHSYAAMMPNQVENIYKRIELLKSRGEDVEAIKHKTNRPINGEDVMLVCNIPPSPQVKKILAMVDDLLLETPNLNRDYLLEFIKRIKL